MVTLVICHAAMTGWVTKIQDGIVRKVSKIGLKNAIKTQKALACLPRSIAIANAWGKTFATFQGGLFGLMVDLSGFQVAFLATGFISLLSAFAVVPIRK